MERLRTEQQMSSGDQIDNYNNSHHRRAWWKAGTGEKVSRTDLSSFCARAKDLRAYFQPATRRARKERDSVVMTDLSRCYGQMVDVCSRKKAARSHRDGWFRVFVFEERRKLKLRINEILF